MGSNGAQYITVDGNEAVARIAHKVNEVCAIYPITPATPMGELADELSARGERNIWGAIPAIIEMQSEAGAAGAVHGALQAGALATTFTASQGLLLMLPNMFKIAGELTPVVIHVAARTVATHALSIFCDHSDVMAARNTGWGLWCSASVQEAHDGALLTQAATLDSRVPILHFFDGFRTSHEVQKILSLPEGALTAMLDESRIIEHRRRALNPEHPVLRGSAQNPDVFFQAREACNPFYQQAPEIFQRAMDRFAALTGRQYRLFEYFGAPDAERVLLAMGSATETIKKTCDYLAAAGEKIGLIQVRVYRPFAGEALLAALPPTVRRIAVLDRTKEPGAVGEPLYCDVATTILQSGRPIQLIGGRYGLSSKEFTPAMVKAVFDELQQERPRNQFTVGIQDDVSGGSLDYAPDWIIADKDTFSAMFWGLGSDGTVGAAKNTIKIIGDHTPSFSQGYFVYDSKKSGSVTISHLRVSPKPVRSAYLVQSANLIACHQFGFLTQFDVLEKIRPGGIFLLNAPYSAAEVWGHLPRRVREKIIAARLKFYVIDAHRLAAECGISGRINTIMQTAFFAVAGILPHDQAAASIEETIRNTYGRKGEVIVQVNLEAIRRAEQALEAVQVPAAVTANAAEAGNGPDGLNGLNGRSGGSADDTTAGVDPAAPEYFRRVLQQIIELKGDALPVSAFAPDGTFPTATSRWEKRNIATEIPVWDPEICIQCNKCSIVCPNSCIRIKIYEPEQLQSAPPTFKHTAARDKEFKDLSYTLQVAAEDCTGCGVCVDICPVKNKRQPKFKALNLAPQEPLRPAERDNFSFFQSIRSLDRSRFDPSRVKGSQLLPSRFEFGGNCPGCGETPYLNLLSQLYGDRALIANATGCSSIYGGNLPTTPWSVDEHGRGPAWCNSLFEDNAEFGLGLRLALDQQQQQARELLGRLRWEIGGDLTNALLQSDQSNEQELLLQRKRIMQLKERLQNGANRPEIHQLLSLADTLLKKSVWLIGGDGWAFDIGFGGLDHVFSTGRNVNILVLDTGVYSNTGGQCSKATPCAAVAKFASAGKTTPRKDLGLIAMSYGNVYVAQVALGANDNHTVRAFHEAESWPGVSLIIAYSQCIAHGVNMRTAMSGQKNAVDCGFWPLYRFDPRRAAAGESPLQLDSHAPKIAFAKWAQEETRFRMLQLADAGRAAELTQLAQEQIEQRWRLYEHLVETFNGRQTVTVKDGTGN